MRESDSCRTCSRYTRAERGTTGLSTRRYQRRFGHELNAPSPSPAGFGLLLEEITLAEKIRAAGYATGLVIKWHLGSEAQFHPMSRGFDEFFGFLVSELEAELAAWQTELVPELW